MKLTLGSLFEGSGGFSLAGILADIEPKWSSEIEPFPIRVTTKRLPKVKHYGDVSTLNGGDLEPVDIITFGSPCTDVSMAGRREGIHAPRSGLFFQAIRIVKEMRKKTNGNFPRFIVWENVRGALSSNDGWDFRDVLKAIAEIKDGEVSIPKPNKWLNAGECVGRDFSIAWRVLDAQYFGVPQRRARIFLVADFAGQCASEILFESTSGPGNTTESQGTWQRDTAETTGSPRGGSGTSLMFENHSQDSRYRGPLETAMTVAATYGTGGNNQPLVVENSAFAAEGYARWQPTNTGITLRASGGDLGGGSENLVVEKNCYGICSKDSNAFKSSNPRSGIYDAQTSRTLDTNGGSPACNQGGIAVVETTYCLGHDVRSASYTPNIADPLTATDYKDPSRVNHHARVRKLTPLECGRLQGFPDNWCTDLETPEPTEDDLAFWRDVFETHRKVTGSSSKPKSDKAIIKWLKSPHSDSAEYKMWGNGVALPCVHFVLSRLAQIANEGGLLHG